MMTHESLNLLIAARDLVGRGRCARAFARDANMYSIGVLSNEAIYFCPHGALGRAKAEMLASRETYNAARLALARARGLHDDDDDNLSQDSDAAAHDEVMRWFNVAIILTMNELDDAATHDGVMKILLTQLERDPREENL